MRVLYISLAVFLFDQITKFAVKGFSIPFLGIHWEGMYIGESIEIIGTFLRITFVENPGMAFGFEVTVIQKLFLSLFTLVAAIAIFYYLYKSKNESIALRIGLALILGGALGNLMDRAFYGIFYDYAPLLYGKVVDFIQVEFWDFTLFGKTYETWPIFNIADSAVTVGVAVILIFHREEKTDPVKDGEDLEVESGNEEKILEHPQEVENGEHSNRENLSV